MLALSSRSPQARPLLETSARLAGQLQAEWFVVHVRQPPTLHYRREATTHPVPEEDLAYARKLGGRVIIERGEIIKALISFGRTMSIRYFVTGRSFRPRLSFVWQWPLTEAIQRELPGAMVIII